VKFAKGASAAPDGAQGATRAAFSSYEALGRVVGLEKKPHSP
jgi:hypothetical protein